MAGHGWRLVGRSPDLATLTARREAARRGRGRAVVVLGDPGIGKTALVEALAADVDRERMRVAWGRCTESDAPAFWPWRQALQALGAEPPLAAESRPELFARVVEALAGADRPVLLVLEDIHWADPASLALLRFVVDAVPGLPLLLVATARDAPAEAGPEVIALLRALPPGVERLALAGLPPDAVAEIAARVLGRPADPELADRIIHRCGGNPFFVREVAQLHASRGAGAAPAVPPGVQQVLARRLTRLGQPCQDLLAVAAVVGEPELDLVAEVVGQPRATVLQGFGEAVTARLLDSDGEHLRFVHALVREAVVAQLPPATVGELHRRIAEALERRGPDTPAARLATHWRRAGGEHAGRRAATHALAAARAARERLGYEQAVQFYGWALAAPPADELAIRIERGEAQMVAGDPTAGREALRDAAREARRAGRPRELALAVLAAGVGGFEVALHDDEQVELLAEALDALDPATETGLRAAALARLSLAAAGRRPVEERVRLAEEGVGLSRAVGDPVTEVASLAAWCDARSGPDHIDARSARTGQMVAAAQRGGDPASLLLARRLRLVALADRGDFAGVDAEIAAYAGTAERLRLPLYSWPVPIWRGARALMSGDVEAARAYQTEAEALAARAGSINGTMLALVLELALLGSTGEPAAIAAATDRLLELVTPDHPQVSSLAGFYAAAGRHDDARRLLDRQLAAGLAALPNDSEWLPAVWLLADAAMALAEPDPAIQLYEALRPYAHRWVVDGIFAACFGLAAHQLGRLAAFLERPDEARGWLEQARRAHREAGASLLLARTERALAALSGAPPASGETRVVAGEFRRSGRTWQLRWEGDPVTVPDSKGMRDLAVLLAAPDRDVHVLDLVEAAGGPPAATAGGHSGERLDQPARTAYRQRLTELASELSEAEANSDAGRAEALRREQDFLATELAGALGLGGRARTDGDPVERARKAVTMRIRTALRAIAEVSPALARHLDRSVSTGRLCAYRPEHPVRWRF